MLLEPLKPTIVEPLQIASQTADSCAVFPVYAPHHVESGKVRRRGVFACVSQESLSEHTWALLKAWKALPTAYPQVTERLAQDLARLIREVLPVIPLEWLITCCPPGVSAGKEYAVGFLAKQVAQLLDREYVTVFEDQINKRWHGRFESLRMPDVMTLRYAPDVPLIVVDDFITSGRTMRASLAALERAGVCSFGFAWAAF